jgi:hypothetical protein
MELSPHKRFLLAKLKKKYGRKKGEAKLASPFDG